MSKLQSINPSTYEVIGEVDISTESEIKEKIRLAHEAKEEWKAMGLEKRIKLLNKVKEEFVEHKKDFTLLQAKEMGMPLSQTIEDYDATIGYIEWYLKNAHTFLSPEITGETDSEISTVYYEPIGVNVCLLPWNFPFANFVWGCFQSLIAGNTLVLKHSEECPLSGQMIERIFSHYDLPKGVFNEVYGDGEIGQILVNQDIDLLTFIGSTKVGKQLYAQAGQKFIPANMEMGGSAPGVIFDDADVDLAVGTVCFIRLLNQGQCCDGLKRLIVHESVFDQVVDKLVQNFSSKKVGNAVLMDTDIGPLVAKRQLDLLVSQVEDAKEKGVKIEVGGEALASELGGAFYQPTLLTNVTNDMRVWKEEVFGPVLPIVSFNTEEEAIQLANETEFGLGSNVFTKDKERASRFAMKAQSGMVSINGANYIQPYNPFGGYKNSGIGREHGKYGFHEVTQIKVVSQPK